MHMKYDITLLTASAYLNPKDPDWYVQQILTEDEILRSALERRGLRVHRIDWTNKEFDWSTTKFVLFRAVWDYIQRYEEFLAFLNFVSTKTLLINTLEIILWNLDKHYLRDLHNRGINIPKTIYIEKGDQTTLHKLYEENNLTETILKPAMSAGARHTYRLNNDNLEKHEDIFQQLIANEALMFQPFLHSIINRGEITLVVIGRKYTHAILKRAKTGDFRVQDDFGGTVVSYTPTEEEISFAEHVVSVCFPIPSYARVDMIIDNNGNLAVSELELIEPELWFRFEPTAANELAENIKQLLGLSI
jgi:glutathione synthase/RimK-type ligase-like ATP-grasp enzyme